VGKEKRIKIKDDKGRKRGKIKGKQNKIKVEERGKKVKRKQK
jgi:hypothetical protein